MIIGTVHLSLATVNLTIEKCQFHNRKVASIIIIPCRPLYNIKVVVALLQGPPWQFRTPPSPLSFRTTLSTRVRCEPNLILEKWDGTGLMVNLR